MFKIKLLQIMLASRTITDLISSDREKWDLILFIQQEIYLIEENSTLKILFANYHCNFVKVHNASHLQKLLNFK